jgi:citrate synthase
VNEQIADFAVNELHVRGLSIKAMIETMSFIDCLIWVLVGQASDEHTTAMLNGLLVAWCDHGQEPPSTQNVRNVASVKASFPAACIAGLATFGGSHAPIERAADFLQEMEIRSESEATQLELVRKAGRIPGFGHPVHSRDPRVGPLLALAAANIDNLRHLQALHDAEKILATIYPDKDLHANLAGVTAAIWLDLGFEIEAVSLIPVLGRMVGWAAHYTDQRNLPAFDGSVPPLAN